MELAEGMRRAGETARLVAKATRFWVTNVTPTPSLGLLRRPLLARHRPLGLRQVPGLEDLWRGGSREAGGRDLAAREDAHAGARGPSPLALRRRVRARGFERSRRQVGRGCAPEAVRDLVHLSAAQALRAGRPRRERLAQGDEAGGLRPQEAPSSPGIAGCVVPLPGRPLANPATHDDFRGVRAHRGRC